MAKYVVDSESLTAIADAIREKTGKTESLTLDEMPTEVASIEGEGNTKELETQIADLTAENTELATRIEKLETENAELTARIKELEGGSSGDDSGGDDGGDDDMGDSGDTSSNTFPTAAPGVYEHGSNFTKMLYDWYDLCKGNNDDESWLEASDEGAYTKEIDAAIHGDVVIPEGVVSLYEFECGSVVLPASLTTIKKSIYESKYVPMEVMYVKATEPPLLMNIFEEGVPNLTKIVVPKGSGDAYKSATNWSAFADIIVEADEDGNNSGGSTDQTALAGAYTADGTFSNREYTWDQMVERRVTSSPPYFDVSEEDRYVEASGFDIVVPDTEPYVGYFYCNNIVLPKTTTKVEGSDASKMGKVYVKATTPPELYEWAFFECTDVEIGGTSAGQVGAFDGIVVPVGCLEAYKSATNWSLYADYITEGEMPI